MSVNLTINGQTFAYPEVGDTDWGTSATLWATAATNGMLQKAGGTFTLLADVNFGATFGIVSAYYKSTTADISTAGALRLAQADSIGWRNNANSGNLLLSVSSDALQFNGASLVISGLIVNADISPSAAIAYSKLNLATSIVNADISGSAAIAYSKLNLATSIVNADISGSAAIDFSKLAGVVDLTTAQTVAGVKTLSDNLIVDNGKEIRLQEATANGTNYLAIKSPTAVTTTTTFTLPDGDGSSNQVLQTNGSATLQWATVAAGIGTNFSVHTVTSADYTILSNDGYRHILVSTGASNRTITLPAAASSTDRIITIKKTDSGVGTVTVARAGSNTIDGNTSVVLRAQYQPTTIVCDGTNWYVEEGGVDDITATRLGQKAYAHGTTYNGGNAPTITLDSGGGTLSSVNYSSFIPYQMQDGSWRMRFNVGVTLSSAVRTQATIRVNGVTSIATYYQGVSGCSEITTATLQYAMFEGGSGDIIVAHASATTSIYNYSGDVALASKPTWAY